MSAKILIVDDEPDLLELVGYTLYGAGYQALTALSGEEALRKVETELPDLIILDVMMPGMSGLDVLRELRARPATAGLPVIILSARTQVPARIAGLEAGADEYVDKPVAPKELIARVGALLERTRRIREAATGRHGRVFSCIGAKGGVGTTTVAVNLALALTTRDKRLAVVELQPGPGTMVHQLGREPSRTLADLLEDEPEKLDEAYLQQALTAYPGGVQVLPASPAAYGAEPLTVDHTRSLIRSLAQMADVTILDLPSRPSPATRAALRQSDVVLLVCEPDGASLGAARILLQQMIKWEVERAIIGIVLVRHADNSAALTRREVEARVGQWIVADIPAAPTLFVNALKANQTFLTHRPESTVATALTGLAAKLVPAG